MKARDVKVGAHVQVGADGHWPDEPRRAEIVGYEIRFTHHRQRMVRVRWLLPDGSPDPTPVSAEWWWPRELVPWEPWRAEWAKREARRSHRRSIINRLVEALEQAGLGDLVSVQSGQHVTGTVHMVIGDLADTEVVADRLRRLAGH